PPLSSPPALLPFSSAHCHLHPFPTRRSSDLFYAEVDLYYDASIADENNGKPFAVGSLRPIQLSTRDSLSHLAEGRSRFTTEQWKDRKSTRLNSSHVSISYAVFCLKKKTKKHK